jgi:hypothetical protein
VNIDTDQFRAITGRLAELAARVELLERRDEQRAAIGVELYHAGREAARRELGLPATRPGDTHPRHLRSVQGDR